MSETNSIDGQTVEPQMDVIELGSASEVTRGSPGLLGVLDGGIIWPLIFYKP